MSAPVQLVTPFGFADSCGPALVVETRIYDGEMEKSTDLAVLDEDEEELRKLKYQYGWLKVSRMKLCLDLVFVCECSNRPLGKKIW